MSGYATRMHSAQLPSTAHRRASAGPLPATHNFHLQIPNWPIAELKVWCGVQVGRDEEVRIALNLEHYVPRHRASAAADDDNETTAVLVTLVC